MASLTIQQYDRGIKVFFTIKIDGIIESINNARVYFKLKNRTTGAELIRECKITDAEMGECMYVFTEEDTREVGSYITEVQTEFENGTRLSVDNPITLDITPQLIGGHGRSIRMF